MIFHVIRRVPGDVQAGRLEPKRLVDRLGQQTTILDDLAALIGVVAELGAFLISERAAYINGAVITVDGGYGVRFA